MNKQSENLLQAFAHLESAKESILKSSKDYHLRQANILAFGEPIDADEIDLGLLSNKLSKMERHSEELINELKIIVDKYDITDENVLKVLLNYKEELIEVRRRNSKS